MAKDATKTDLRDGLPGHDAGNSSYGADLVAWCLPGGTAAAPASTRPVREER